MKKSKTCPKCGYKSISFADRIYTGGGFGGNEYLGLEPKSNGRHEEQIYSPYL